MKLLSLRGMMRMNDIVSEPPKPVNTNPQTPKTKSIRRIGTVTMGLALIATGIIILARMIDPEFDLIQVAKFSPVILICLGFEVLFAYFAGKGEKLKYDFLSGFVCLILISASLGLAAAEPVYNLYGPNRYRAEAVIENEITEQYSQRLSGLPVANINAAVSIDRFDRNYQSAVDLQPWDSASLSIYFADSYETKADFAIQCREALDRLADYDITFESIYLNDGERALSQQEGREVYRLQISGDTGRNLSADELAKLIY